LDRTGTVATAAADAVPAATVIRFLLKLILIDVAALILIGAVILFTAAAWEGIWVAKQ
jgi:hypothetical protein